MLSVNIYILLRNREKSPKKTIDKDVSPENTPLSHNNQNTFIHKNDSHVPTNRREEIPLWIEEQQDFCGADEFSKKWSEVFVYLQNNTWPPYRKKLPPLPSQIALKDVAAYLPEYSKQYNTRESSIWRFCLHIIDFVRTLFLHTKNAIENYRAQKSSTEKTQHPERQEQKISDDIHLLKDIFPDWNLPLYVVSAMSIPIVSSFLPLETPGHIFLFIAVFDIRFFIRPMLKLSYRLGDSFLHRISGIWGLAHIVLYVLFGIQFIIQKGLSKIRPHYGNNYSVGNKRELIQYLEISQSLEGVFLIIVLVSTLLFMFFLYQSLKNICNRNHVTINPILYFLGFQYGYPKYLVDKVTVGTSDISVEEDFGFFRMILFIFKGGWALFIFIWAFNMISRSC